jgi:hypothetical protein
MARYATRRLSTQADAAKMLGISLRNLKSMVCTREIAIERPNGPNEHSRVRIGEWSSQAENRPRPLCGSLGSGERLVSAAFAAARRPWLPTSLPTDERRTGPTRHCFRQRGFTTVTGKTAARTPVCIQWFSSGCTARNRHGTTVNKALPRLYFQCGVPVH